MSNTIKLYSISELLEMNFYIPAYQRGYRWTEQQVKDLLSDIYSFALKDKSKKEFYCLQPIVVKEHNWERKNDEGIIKQIFGWEVVDGQQRLTTLKIILSYFIKSHLSGKPFKERYGKDIFTIDYETREDSKKFLNNITVGNDENIDFYHISQAYTTIGKWLKNKVEQEKIMLDDICDSILRTLVYNQKNQKSEGVVQVIWYELNESSNPNSSPIKTFIRINGGKISLTNSELIKALFLQERNFGEVNDLSRLRQLEIASDWDRIENMLQDDDFWWFLNKEENKIPARIEFVFDIIKSVAIKNDPEVLDRIKMTPAEIESRKKSNPTIEEVIGTDRYATFRYFSPKFEKQVDLETIKREWKIIKDYFQTFEEWYNNPIWYHYVGFLIYCGEEIVDIYNLHQKNNVTKKDITKAFKDKIKSRFDKLKWKENEETKEAKTDIKTYYLDLYFSDSNKPKIRELLLLYNLEHIVKQSINKTLIYKFPFKAFKEVINDKGNKISWDVEHIDSTKSNELTDKDSQITWLQTSKDDVEEIQKDEQLCARIDDFTKNKNSKESFEDINNEIIRIAGEVNDENTKEIKNNIGNLTLLDASTNRSYGNALFPTKRKIIIKKDMKGTFIPICTKNLFLKYFDLKGTLKSKWSIDDIKNYRTDITTTLVEFLPKKY